MATEEAMYVVNRGGEKEEVKFDRITDRNRTLCSAAYGRELGGVNCTKITAMIIARFRSGMTTRELDRETARVCGSLSSANRDYADLAARILISDLQKSTPSSALEVVRRIRAGRSPRLSDEYAAFVERFGAEIDARLDFSRDFRFTLFGIETMMRSYLLHEDGEDSPLVERPQHAFMRVALQIWCCTPGRDGHRMADDSAGLCLEEAFKVYDKLSTQEISHASPTIFNAGTRTSSAVDNGPQLSSCFLLAVDDDLDVLYQVVKDAAMASKIGGGIGVSLSRMRSEGALIRSTGGAASGVLRYLGLNNQSQLYANQGGKRPGAFAMYLEVWHADVLTFIEAGRFLGPLVERRQDAPDLKYALWVPDLFMEAVVDELVVRARLDAGEPVPETEVARAGEWYLFSPDEAPGLQDAWDRARGRDAPDDQREFRALYGQYVAEKRYRRRLKASEIIGEWFRTVTQRGNPYILYKDAINRKSNLQHVRTIYGSNLCVSGDTLILTDQGHLPIASLVGREVRVWNGREWSAVTPRQTGIGRRLFRVTLDNGAVLDCTPEHKFYDAQGNEVRAEELSPGTVLESPREWPAVDPPDAAPLPDPYEAGKSFRTRHFFGVVDSPAKEIPLCASASDRIKWLAGFLDKGCEMGRGQFICAPVLELRFPPHQVPLLGTLRLLLESLGYSPIVRREEYCVRHSPYLMTLETPELRDLCKRGFAPANFAFAGEADSGEVRKSPRLVRVKKWPEPLPEPADTFCFTEPLRHRGVFNGVLTGQCAEITIPSWRDEGKPEEAEYGVCTLGAVNLARFVVPDVSARNPGRVRFDFAGVIEAAGILACNLDNIIDLNCYAGEPYRRSSLRHRPLGIGVMGLADVFARFRYAFGSAEAQDLDEAIHACVYYGAMLQSSELGRSRGNFPSFPGCPASRGRLQPDLWEAAGDLKPGWAERVAETTRGALTPEMWDALRGACREHLRNAYVTALMPTATSSNVAGVNECFEPFTGNVYVRKTSAGEFVIINPHLLEELKGAWDDEMRREVIAAGGSVQGVARIPEDVRRRYKTARELDQRWLVRHAARRGPFVSQTQSLNLYFSDPVLRDALTALVEGWRLGNTTGVYYSHQKPATGGQKTSVGGGAGGGAGSPEGCAAAQKKGPLRAPESGQMCAPGCEACAV